MEQTDLTVAVAAFHDRETAVRAVADLERHGFNQKQIGVISQGPQGDLRKNADVIGRNHVKGALLGLLSGAVLGTVIGLVWAYVQSQSPLALALGGLVIGAVLGLVIGAITGMGVPKRDPQWFSKQFEKGQSVVTVMADRRHEEAWEILRRNGGFEVADQLLPETAGDETELAGRASGGQGRSADEAAALRDRSATREGEAAAPVAAEPRSTVPAGRPEPVDKASLPASQAPLPPTAEAP